MKNLVKLTVISIFIFAVLLSCGNPITGMWIEDTADGSTEGYWINFGDENSFEYIVLSGQHNIQVFYIGTYEINSKEKTITLTAEEETDGSQNGSVYNWTASTWTQTVTYATEGDNLILTLDDGTTITLKTREQSVELQRSIASVK